uniref:Uncharacterized protein n=1 Tax=Anopheles farauti TaxID=69004 RepID=A0A182QDP4_9DIPT
MKWKGKGKQCWLHSGSSTDLYTKHPHALTKQKSKRYLYSGLRSEFLVPLETFTYTFCTSSYLVQVPPIQLLGLLAAGCFLLGVTLANETNKDHRLKHNLEQQLLRNKRGLLSALFGAGGAEQTTAQPTEVLPVYGDPAQPPLHMLYGHSTGLQGPYPPYPVMFVPGAPALGGQSPYLPMLAYGGVAPASFQAGLGENNHLPTVIGWQEPTAFPPLAPPTTPPAFASVQPSTPETPAAGQSKQTTPSQTVQGQAKSAYLMKLNLSPSEERELKRLAKLLGVTDFEHLPPLEDVQALLGTTTSAETIKAIKEYASTPDGLELIKDYVMSYQPAKRISLGKEPYGGNGVEPTKLSDTTTATDAPASTLGSGFLAQLRRLKSLLTFGYFDASDDAPAEAALANEIVAPEVAPSEAPFTPNEFPGFEVRDVHGSPVPMAHYLVPIRTLPRRTSASELKYASALPFPYAVHYPSVMPQLQDANPFVLRKETETLPFATDIPQRIVGGDSSLKGSSDATLPTRIAPPTLATGELHSFERVDIEQPIRTTTPTEQHQEVIASSTVVEENAAPALVADVAEFADDTTDFILNVLDAA